VAKQDSACTEDGPVFSAETFDRWAWPNWDYDIEIRALGLEEAFLALTGDNEGATR